MTTTNEQILSAVTELGKSVISLNKRIDYLENKQSKQVSTKVVSNDADLVKAKSALASKMKIIKEATGKCYYTGEIRRAPARKGDTTPHFLVKKTNGKSSRFSLNVNGKLQYVKTYK